MYNQLYQQQYNYPYKGRIFFIIKRDLSWKVMSIFLSFSNVFFFFQIFFNDFSHLLNVSAFCFYQNFFCRILFFWICIYSYKIYSSLFINWHVVFCFCLLFEMLLTVFSQLPYCLLLLLSIATLFTVFFCQLPRCLLFFLAISMLFSVFYHLQCSLLFCFLNFHSVCCFYSQLPCCLQFFVNCSVSVIRCFLSIAKLFAFFINCQIVCCFFVNCQVVFCKMLTDVFCNLKMFFDVVCHFVS